MAHQHIQDEVASTARALSGHWVNETDRKATVVLTRRWRKAEVIAKLSQKAVRYLNPWGAIGEIGACYVVGDETHWTRHDQVQLIRITWETWMGLGSQDGETRPIKGYNWRGVATLAVRAMELPRDEKWRRGLPRPRRRFWRKLHFGMGVQIMRAERGFLPEEIDEVAQDPEEAMLRKGRLARANVGMGITLKGLWMLPISMPGRNEATGETWGRVMRLYARALNALLCEATCDLEGEGATVRLAMRYWDGGPRGRWETGRVELMEGAGCQLMKDAMGQAKAKNCWRKETNVFGELMDDPGANYGAIGMS